MLKFSTFWGRIGTRLYLGLACAVFLILVSSAVGVWRFENSGQHTYRMRDETVPALEAAWQVYADAQSLVGMGIAQVGLIDSDDVAAVLARVVDGLDRVGEGPSLRPEADRVGVSAGKVAGHVDDLIVGRQSLEDTARDVEAMINRLDLAAGADRTILAAEVVVRDGLRSTNLADLRKVRGEMDELLSRPPGFRAEHVELFNQVFDAKESYLDSGERVAAAESALDAEASEMAEALNALLVAAREESDAGLTAAVQSFDRGRIMLLVISVASVLAAAAVAWLWVGRRLLRRWSRLSERMQAMSRGDFNTPVPEREIGDDEIGQLAGTLEELRQYALEAQRLNLVEQLAEELRGRNDELEQALSDLSTAQDQIVMREKLASLGELTAGVAHEIRNPLNFVKNFSEVSEELLEEMKETIEESEDGALDEEQRELLDDIFGELSGNLERIQTHGDRANRIVHDMLMMSRESVGHQPTNINNLLDEHARLAYHSARATDSNFQLDLQYDFDPDMEEIEVNPQDVGRVFLNIVNNGCYATNEKRLKLAEAEPGSDYMPTLLLTTRRGEERIEVRIRDNGTGMPPAVIEKMFNPFFTTKPTDKGTGLGLSICNDIIRRHGGEILVESKPGEFTEMTIDLPLHPPMEDEDHEDIYDNDDDWEDDEDAVGVADAEAGEAV